MDNVLKVRQRQVEEKQAKAEAEKHQKQLDLEEIQKECQKIQEEQKSSADRKAKIRDQYKSDILQQIEKRNIETLKANDAKHSMNSLDALREHPKQLQMRRNQAKEVEAFNKQMIVDKIALKRGDMNRNELEDLKLREYKKQIKDFNLERKSIEESVIKKRQEKSEKLKEVMNSRINVKDETIERIMKGENLLEMNVLLEDEKR